MSTLRVVALATLLVGALACGGRGDPAVTCPKIPSWDECAKASRCVPVRFTVHKGYTGPAWACQPKP
jgi:hypothetical protein